MREDSSRSCLSPELVWVTAVPHSLHGKEPSDLGLRYHLPVIDPLISLEGPNDLEGPYPASIHYSNTNRKTIVLQNSHLGVGSTLWRETGFQIIIKMVTFKQ